MKNLILVGLLFSCLVLNANNKVYIKIIATDSEISKIQSVIKSLQVDDVGDRYITAYVEEKELEKLKTINYQYKLDTPLRYKLHSEFIKGSTVNYHTYETMTAELQNLVNRYPNIAKINDIGKSTLGRSLWFVKITSDVQNETDKPEVRLSSTMHGDEIVGQELLIYLIQYLLENYSSNEKIKSLVDNTEIWIMPNMNPDGTAAKRRYNAQHIDLNRDFPDMTQNEDPNSMTGRATETKHIMNFIRSRHFSLGMNFHTGALVVNTPWDAKSTTPPDYDFINNIALAYAEKNLPMYNSSEFQNGVVNGYDWYPVYGGMQDWSYYFYNEIHLTTELYDEKWPSASKLPKLWENNRDSLLDFIAQVQRGIHGRVYDKATHKPLRASISFLEFGHEVYSSENFGDYHKLAYSGKYSLKISAPNYKEVIINNIIVPTSGKIDNIDIELEHI